MELLPPFIQGWYLLHNANLNQTERNLIQTALAGDYDVDKVAQELRNQWSDTDIRHRDQGRHGGYLGDVAEEEDVPEEENDAAWSTHTEMTEEGQALLTEVEHEVHEALLAANGARRTLRDARMRQHQVKMNRQYYRAGPPRNQPSSSSTRPSGSRPSDASMVCLRCGKTGHRAAVCPEPKPASQQANHTQDEHAPFVCFVESAHQAEEATAMTAENNHMTTAEAVKGGHAIIDSGATRTLSSVYAIERLMAANQDAHGQARVNDVDVTDCPTFAFGNSSSDKCLSTVRMEVTAGGKTGDLRIHALDKGEGPILLSIATLRALKAVIDFSEDLVVFRALNPRKVIKAGRSATGHQLLSLSEDLYKDATEVAQEIPSLKAFLPNQE